MSLKLTAAVLVAAAVAAGPAFACMGPTVIFSDSFQTLDPAWVNVGTLNVAGGNAQLTPSPGDWAMADYQGMFVDSGDACVDVLSPTVAAPVQAAAGLIFGADQTGNFYVFAVEEDGQAAVLQNQNGTWVYPVAWRAAPALTSGGNVTNTLRVTWKGTSASAYINGQPFVTFDIPASKNTTFGIWCEGDPGTNPTAGAIYQFSNLKVTNIP